MRSPPRYGSRRYRRLRGRVLAEQPICAACGREPSQEVDHIVPRAKGGGNERTNLQGLCRECHERKTAAENAGGERRRLAALNEAWGL